MQILRTPLGLSCLCSCYATPMSFGAPATFWLRSRRVVLPDRTAPATLCLSGGKIADVLPWEAPAPAATVLDVGEHAVLPGLVDTHVHINDPGRADWEGFPTATRAAIAGGITSLVDMPLNSIPPTTSVAGLAAKRAAAAGRIHANVGFWGGVVPGNQAELEPLWSAGVLGFKCFLSPSGVDEFPAIAEADLDEALPILASLGAPLLVHAEWPAVLEAAAATRAAGDARSYQRYLASRPAAAEAAAIRRIATRAGAAGVHVHIVHVASAVAVDATRAARLAGVALSAETCPHYLTFAAEDIADGATAWKCAPPIRGASEREALWQALSGGDLDLVASDHSPSPPHLKSLDDGNFDRAWGGISSLQVALAAVWTGAQRRGLPLHRLARWLSAAPARLAALSTKGAIRPGADADLVVFDPEAEHTVHGARLAHRHSLTPYEGLTLLGEVRQTWIAGQLVYDRGDFSPPSGELLHR
jgi:allantoinase